MKKITFKNFNVDYKILNPGGNKTALIIGTDYTDEDKREINNRILNDNPDVEQVGFISKKDAVLEMAGGEFCVNATRCAVWDFLNGNSGEIELSVSGCQEKIRGGISSSGDVYASMKLNKSMDKMIKREGIFNLIQLDGILLIVLDEKNSSSYIKELKNNQEITKMKLKKIMKTFKTKEKAVGIILLEKIKKNIKINPVIWVKTVDTLYYETACGSGSLATAIYMNYYEGIENLRILQPSGYSINVRINKKGKELKSAIISGIVIEEI